MVTVTTELIGQNNFSVKKGARVLADIQGQRKVPQGGKTVSVTKKK